MASLSYAVEVGETIRLVRHLWEEVGRGLLQGIVILELLLS